jgi:coenzyme Q-binding protein COQ10
MANVEPMPTFQTRHFVPYSPRQMYDLVADVERYPQFLPLVDGLRVLRREQQDPATVLTATMSVGYKAIRETFGTRVTLKPNDLLIVAHYLDGPFRQLENRWQFPAATRNGVSGTDIDFYITYEFKSMMLGMLVGAMFDQAFRKFTSAFEARARVVYGTPVAVSAALANRDVSTKPIPIS